GTGRRARSGWRRTRTTSPCTRSTRWILHAVAKPSGSARWQRRAWPALPAHSRRSAAVTRACATRWPSRSRSYETMPDTIRVTAHLLTPVAFHPAEGIALDAALLYAVMLEQHEDAYFRPPDNAEVGRVTAEPHPDMPLAVHRAGGLWCY